MGGSYPKREKNQSHWAVVDARTNKGLGKGKELQGFMLAQQEVTDGKLEVQKPLELGKARSTDIIQITAINTSRLYRREYADKVGQGKKTDIRERFRKIVQGK